MRVLSDVIYGPIRRRHVIWHVANPCRDRIRLLLLALLLYKFIRIRYVSRKLQIACIDKMERNRCCNLNGKPNVHVIQGLKLFPNYIYHLHPSLAKLDPDSKLSIRDHYQISAIPNSHIYSYLIQQHHVHIYSTRINTLCVSKD
jgi:hypothetical protein